MNTIDWLLDSDPTLRWQVEKDITNQPKDIWQVTKEQMLQVGFARRLLDHQKNDGTWLHGAHVPKDFDWQGPQPWTATGWSLTQLREWGVTPEALLPDTATLLKKLTWEYEDRPFWEGEVDVCINAYTLANGAWLGLDMSHLLDWFEDHQLSDGGWNCDWIDGSKVASFHSTLNALIALLAYEEYTGSSDRSARMRQCGEEYLLDRRLMYQKGTGKIHDWALHLSYPFYFHYSVLRSLDYFRQAAQFEKKLPDERLEPAINYLEQVRNPDGRWYTDYDKPGEVWFEIDSKAGEASRWLTFYALRIQKWWKQREIVERFLAF